MRGRRAGRLLLVAVAIVGLAAEARAEKLSLQQQVVVLNEAQRAFDEGAALRQSNPTRAATSFNQAAAKFQLLVDSGLKNGKLYYNLGNAYLESGQVAQSILNYRRAQELIPDDARLVANLRYARSLRRNQIPESGEQALLHTLFFWHYRTSLRGRFWLGLAAYLLLWGLLIIRVFRPRLHWRYAIIPVLIICAALTASVGVSLADHASRHAGVIVADNVVVRKGNGEGFEPQFQQELHEGVEFDLLEKRADWLFIALPDGKTGWIRSRDAEMI